MDFAVLGPFRVTQGSRTITPAAPKLREVLTLLAICSPKVVLTRTLIEELWGERPPRSAQTTLQTYIYQLRKTVSTPEDPDAGTRLLHTKPFGYLAQLDPGQVDAHVFERKAKAGRAALADGTDELAAELLREALSLWRGPVFSDVTTGPVLQVQATQLEEAYLRTLELRMEADLRLGRHREMISELKMLVAQYPLDEGLHAKLMLCLYRADRRFEAIEIYQHLRQSLVGELGLEPSPSVRRLHQALLAGDPSLDSEPKRAAATMVMSSGPAQLPWDIGDFVDRPETGQLTEAFTARPQDVMSLAVVSGPPGSGKTVLAVHVARTLRDQFPDGQLFAGLRGRAGEPASPGDVLGQILTAIGLRPDEIPGGLEARSQLFRTWTADRRVLVVLDDAAGLAQIYPLLPGGANCGVIVTSRSRLSGLPGASTIRLWTLERPAATALLRAAAGLEGRSQDCAALEHLARSCGYVPLALRAAGMRLTVNPRWAAEWLTARLHDESAILGELRVGEFNVQDVAARSGVKLAGQDLWALGELAAALPAAGFRLQQVIMALGIDRPRAEDLLDRLLRASMIDISSGDGPEHEDTYQLWPLVRMSVIARTTASRQETPPLARAARLPGRRPRAARHLPGTPAGAWGRSAKSGPPSGGQCRKGQRRKGQCRKGQCRKGQCRTASIPTDRHERQRMADSRKGVRKESVPVARARRAAVSSLPAASRAPSTSSRSPS
jgi:DNA-binding SARP family transcriptional activator